MKTSTLILSLSLAAGAAYLTLPSQSYLDRSHPSTRFPDHTLKLLSTGHSETLGYLSWIQTTLSIGSFTFKEATFDSLALETEMKQIYAFNPQIRQAYISIGALELPLSTSFKLDFLSKGHNAHPKDWQIALYYSYHLAENNDFETAYQTMLPFQQRQDVPQYIQNLANSYKIQKLPKKEALITYIFESEKTNDIWRKKAICKKIQSLIVPDESICGILESSEDLPSKFQKIINLQKNTVKNQT